MNRINFILFFLILIFQKSIAGSLNDIDYINKSELKQIKQEDIAQGMQNIPPKNKIKLLALSKESIPKFKSALPLLFAGLIELYFNTYTKTYTADKQYPHGCGTQNKHNFILLYLPIYFLIDLVLSPSFIINKKFYRSITRHFLFLLGLCFREATYLHLALYSSFLLSNSADNFWLSEFSLLYACGAFFYTLSGIKNSDDILTRIEEYEYNINSSMQLIPENKYFDQASNLFLYINKKIEPICRFPGGSCIWLETRTIEDFYKWIARHKNDTCLNSIIYKVYDYDKYSTKKLAEIFNRYSHCLDDVSRSLNCREFNLIFKLIEKNNKLTEDVITRALQTLGIKVIEVEYFDEEMNTQYKYVGLINDNKNYYIVLGVELNNEFTKFPTTNREIIYDSIFNGSADYLKTSTFVIKFNSIDKIQSIMEYLFLYLGSNHCTCVYDISLKNEQFQHLAKDSMVQINSM